MKPKFCSYCKKEITDDNYEEIDVDEDTGRIYYICDECEKKAGDKDD